MIDLRSLAEQIKDAAHEATLRHDDPLIQSEDVTTSIIDVLEEAFKSWESDQVAELEEELDTYKAVESAYYGESAVKDAYDYNAA